MPTPVPQTPLQRGGQPTRAAGTGPSPEPDSLEADRRRLCETMRLVKRARFNAHKRLESMSTLSLASVSMFSLYLIAVSVHTTQFVENISNYSVKVVSFTSIILSIFILILSFIVEMRSYRARAEAMQTCAMRVARMLQLLEIRRDVTLLELTQAINDYNDVIGACPFNHDDIDFRRAIAERDHNRSRTWASWLGLQALSCYGSFKVCWLYTSLIALPPFVYIAFVV